MLDIPPPARFKPDTPGTNDCSCIMFGNACNNEPTHARVIVAEKTVRIAFESRGNEQNALKEWEEFCRNSGWDAVRGERHVFAHKEPAESTIEKVQAFCNKHCELYTIEMSGS